MIADLHGKYQIEIMNRFHDSYAEYRTGLRKRFVCVIIKQIRLCRKTREKRREESCCFPP